EDGPVLLRERTREPGAIPEVSMHDLCQLRMRDADRPAYDRRHLVDGGICESIPKSVAAHHPRGADDHQAFLTRAVGAAHANGRASIQSTYSSRSAKSHVPSILTNVSL